MKDERESVKAILNKDETMVEFSQRRSRKLVGGAFALFGFSGLIDPVLRGFATYAYALEFLIGLAALYIAVRELALCTQAFVCVTNQRVLCRKIDLLGRPGKVKSIALEDISEAKLCKTAAAWRAHYSGEVLMKFAKGGQYVTPFLDNGQYILDAIRAEKSNLAIAQNEA